MKSARTCSGWGIGSDATTALGALRRNLGGGSAIHIRSRPRAPSLKGPLPNRFSLLPLSMALAISRCTTAPVRLRCTRHSAIDHLAGSGRCVSCWEVRALTTASARWRLSVSSSGSLSYDMFAMVRSSLPAIFCQFWQLWQSIATSLPLNGSRRLRGHIVNYAIDAAHLVDDAIGDRLQHLIRQRDPIRGHAIFGMDGANRAGVSIGALVAHHAH